MSPRPNVTEERKDQILDAATSVFARSGFNKARMDDIVAESGLSKGALYWYFESKDDIIEALMRRFFDIELRDLRELLEAPGTVSERLRQATKNYARDLQQNAGLVPIAYEFYATALRQNDIQQFMRGYLQAFRELFIPLFQQGIESGEFRTFDTEQAAITISAVYEGLILLWLVDPEVIQLEQSSQATIDLLLKGMQV